MAPPAGRSAKVESGKQFTRGRSFRPPVRPLPRTPGYREKRTQAADPQSARRTHRPDPRPFHSNPTPQRDLAKTNPTDPDRPSHSNPTPLTSSRQDEPNQPEDPRSNSNPTRPERSPDRPPTRTQRMTLAQQHPPRRTHRSSPRRQRPERSRPLTLAPGESRSASISYIIAFPNRFRTHFFRRGPDDSRTPTDPPDRHRIGSRPGTPGTAHRRNPNRFDLARQSSPFRSAKRPKWGGNGPNSGRNGPKIDRNRPHSGSWKLTLRDKSK